MSELKISRTAADQAEQWGFDINKVPSSNGTSITIKDVEAYKKTLGNDGAEDLVIEADEAVIEEQNEAVKPDVKVTKQAPKGKYVCVFLIKEDDKIYEVGDAYTGKNAKYFLEKKCIRKN